MNEYLTIKEFADAAGISVQAVYQRIEKDLKQYLKIENGKKTLSNAALELFNNSEYNSSNLTSNLNNFKDILKIFEKQLEEKDRQLSAKDKQIEELNNRLAEAHQMANQAQQLHHADKVLELTESGEPGKSDSEPVPIKEKTKHKLWPFGKNKD